MHPLVRNVPLPTGQLRLTWQPQQFDLDDLCDFACRRNSKRSFLFVSKVLGRYCSITPAAMRTVSQQLAAELSGRDLPGPVVFVGLVEAGVGLGHAIFEDTLAQTGRNDFAFLQTTRFRLDQPLLAEFAEEHSHAPRHFLYQPQDPDTARTVMEARTLVMIDDEATSGRTFDNLYRAISAQLSSLSRTYDVTVTDWRSASATETTGRSVAADYSSVSVFQGEYEFTWNGQDAGQAETAIGNDQFKDAQVAAGFGRLGLDNVLVWDEVSLTKALAAVPTLANAESATNAANRVLVVGTGEFIYPPFRLAERLSGAGHQVDFLASTRSPVEKGLAVDNIRTFVDNYGDEIPNYLYNLQGEQYSSILFCQETQADSAPWNLVWELDAHVLQFESQPNGRISLHCLTPPVPRRRRAKPPAARVGP